MSFKKKLLFTWTEILNYFSLVPQKKLKNLKLGELDLFSMLVADLSIQIIYFYKHKKQIFYEI